VLQRRDDAQGLRVVVEPAVSLQAGIQRPFAGMAERRMAEVVRQRQGFRQILVQPELPGQRAGNLRDFEGVGQPGAVMIAFVEHEYLGFVLQAAKGGGMDHPVAIAPERAAGLARRLGKQPAAAAVGVAGIDRARSSHSDRHGVLILIHLIPQPCALNYVRGRIPNDLGMHRLSESSDMTTGVTISERAARRIGEILKTEGDGAMLRISVEGGGCSGFQYKFDVERAQAEDDLVIARDSAVVLVDPASVPFLAGSEVDFVDDLIGASFRVVNPNATASCGCGTSFSI
jgi:iron-sulfur cluster assembly accessory protein